MDPAQAPDPPAALPRGTRLAEFEVLRVLGIGGFGIVYLALDHALEREVAIKEYMPSSLVGRSGPQRVSLLSQANAESFALGLRSFVNEARLLARFDHPALVKVHRYWEANDTAYMAMPYYTGRNLHAVRRRMDQPPHEAWLRGLLDPLLGALERLHREGVYHRDISPDNVILQPDGQPVLLDFGAARRVLGDKSMVLTAILKPAYAPIEQYGEAGAVKQGPWTDLYALGATLHFLLLGRAPMPATTRMVVDEMQPLASQQATLSGCSAAFLQLIDGMLQPRPADRPQSVAALREALTQLRPPPADATSSGATTQALPPASAESVAPTVMDLSQLRPPTDPAPPLAGAEATQLMSRHHDAASFDPTQLLARAPAAEEASPTVQEGAAGEPAQAATSKPGAAPATSAASAASAAFATSATTFAATIAVPAKAAAVTPPAQGSRPGQPGPPARTASAARVGSAAGAGSSGGQADPLPVGPVARLIEPVEPAEPMMPPAWPSTTQAESGADDGDGDGAAIAGERRAPATAPARSGQRWPLGIGAAGLLGLGLWLAMAPGKPVLDGSAGAGAASAPLATTMAAPASAPELAAAAASTEAAAVPSPSAPSAPSASNASRTAAAADRLAPQLATAISAPVAASAVDGGIANKVGGTAGKPAAKLAVSPQPPARTRAAAPTAEAIEAPPLLPAPTPVPGGAPGLATSITRLPPAAETAATTPGAAPARTPTGPAHATPDLPRPAASAALATAQPPAATTPMSAAVTTHRPPAAAATPRESEPVLLQARALSPSERCEGRVLVALWACIERVCKADTGLRDHPDCVKQRR